VVEYLFYSQELKTPGDFVLDSSKRWLIYWREKSLNLLCFKGISNEEKVRSIDQ